MKKLVFSLALLAGSSASLLAQSTLTAATNNPVVNNSYTSVNVDTTGTFTEATISSNTGAHHVWDFSGLTTTISYDTAKEVTCSSTPHCMLFLSSTNMASQTLSSPTYVYSIVSTDSIAQSGYYQSSTQNLIFTDPMVTIKYPFTYLSSYTDPYAGILTYDPGSGFGAITAYETGTINVSCDGYGTLQLPGGVTDTGVLRVHSSQTFIDSAHVFGVDTVLTANINTYTWLMPGYHSPLLTISFTDQVGTGSGGLHFKTISYAKKYPLGIKNITEIQNSLEVFPNPASGELNIKFEATTSEDVNITVVDLLGRVVANVPHTNKQGIQQVSFNTGSIPAGLYLVRLQSGGQTVTRKIEIR